MNRTTSGSVRGVVMPTPPRPPRPLTSHPPTPRTACRQIHALHNQVFPLRRQLSRRSPHHRRRNRHRKIQPLPPPPVLSNSQRLSRPRRRPPRSRRCPNPRTPHPLRSKPSPLRRPAKRSTRCRPKAMTFWESSARRRRTLKRDPRYAPVWHQPSRSFTDG